MEVEYLKYSSFTLNQPIKHINDGLKDSNPVISVCVTTYQHEAYIAECLDGILNQKTKYSFEILLGEDESSDRTREICLDYAKRYPDIIRLFLHHQENNIKINGVGTGNLNFAYNLLHAKGKYIAICDGDDYWADHSKLEKQITYLEQNEKIAGAYHDTDILYSNKETKPFRTFTKPSKSAEDVIDILSPFHSSSFIFRRSVIKKLPKFILEIASPDLVLFHIVSFQGDIAYIQGVKSIYRKIQSSITTTKIFNGALFYIYRIQLVTLLNEYSNAKHVKEFTAVNTLYTKLMLDEIPLLDKGSLFKAQTKSLLKSLIKG